MIYTTREIINGRPFENGPISRSAGENAAGGALSKCVKTGLEWAPVGHHMPYFVRRCSGGCDAQNACFLEDLRASAPLRLRAARGDINNSAKI